MNQAMLNNPFDQELRSITAPFGALLRSIVETIDEHGLQQRHLERYSSAVAAFFEDLANNLCESDASKALQDRLLNSRDRLFTFLHHDGVSWNNNIAENAIKQFSRYREYVGRSVKAAGLTEHLVLLSLYQTCRMRGLSFLKFLLSRERDIDAFSNSKRPTWVESSHQVAPLAFVPTRPLASRASS